MESNICEISSSPLSSEWKVFKNCKKKTMSGICWLLKYKRIENSLYAWTSVIAISTTRQYSVSLLDQLRKEIALVNKKSWKVWNVLLMSLSLISFMSDGWSVHAATKLSPVMKWPVMEGDTAPIWEFAESAVENTAADKRNPGSTPSQYPVLCKSC